MLHITLVIDEGNARLPKERLQVYLEDALKQKLTADRAIAPGSPMKIVSSSRRTGIGKGNSQGSAATMYETPQGGK